MTHHDTTEDGFHEIQLSAKQLVFLFMTTTVVLVVTFLCGVLVGRSVGPDTDAQQPISAADAPASVDPAVTPEAGTAPPPAVTETPLSYDQRLRKADPQPEKLKPQPEPQEPPKAAPPAAAAPPPTASPAPPAQAAAATLNVPTSGRAGIWFLQVTALKNKPAAADTVRKLIAKGYPAYLENPRAGTPGLYRVRVGRYRTREEAEGAARRLQMEERFTSDIRR